ncbi:hypothetical protein [Ruminococcus flavefaciens]|uniref:hypothetical protein n=1 Tax=Ruminococcus flavefaciens TaxID=1265 RepID=UPI0026EAA981|nr:hypothetical protein [Ruminococcus flavefaciens]
MLQMNIYEEFSHWLDDILENNDMPEETKAFCFNLYEESDEDHIYGAQLIAAGEYDPEDKEGEWACDEVWSCEENIFTVETSDEDDTGWAHAQELIKEMVEEYLKNGKYADILSSAEAVAIGFVDGDLEIIS